MQTPSTPKYVNPSPRVRFQDVKQYVSEHRALMEDPRVQRAMDYAFLEYQRQLCDLKVDGNGAAANHFRMLGAMEFMTTFLLLGEPALQSPKAPEAPALNHRA